MRFILILLISSLPLFIRSGPPDIRLEELVKELELIHNTIKWCNDPGITREMKGRELRAYEKYYNYCYEKEYTRIKVID